MLKKIGIPLFVLIAITISCAIIFSNQEGKTFDPRPFPHSAKDTLDMEFRVIEIQSPSSGTARLINNQETAIAVTWISEYGLPATYRHTYLLEAGDTLKIVSFVPTERLKVATLKGNATFN